VDIYLISVLIFFAILAVIIWRDRKNIEVKYIVLMRRTKKGKKIIDRIVNISPTFWKIVGTIGVLVCLYVMITSFYSIALTLQLMFKKVITFPTIQFLLPTPSSQLVKGPAFIGIPFWFWIIIVATVMFPHELMHGIMMRVEKIRIKSVGLLLLLIFPGAFVDPYEKEFKKTKPISKLRIVAAGSFANFLTAFTLLYLTVLLIWPYFVGPGIVITSVNSTAPAGKIGLKEGMVLQKINNKSMDVTYFDFFNTYGGLMFYSTNMTVDDIKTVSSSLLLRSELKNHKPGENVSLLIDGKTYKITLDKNPADSTLPFIGINTTLNANSYSYSAFTVLFPLLTLCILLNYGIGMFNILPIYPLDGGLMVEGITEKIFPKYSRKIVEMITLITLMLIFFSFAGPFIIK
jgi:membrane-associated protease RseP (regulator of RpoE activity)